MVLQDFLGSFRESYRILAGSCRIQDKILPGILQRILKLFVGSCQGFSTRVMCQKLKILNRIKFNQQISTKLLKRMHQLSINLLCSSDYQTTYGFCEIKHFQTSKEFMHSFSGVTSEKYHMFHHKFPCLKCSLNYTHSIYLWKRRYD